MSKAKVQGQTKIMAYWRSLILAGLSILCTLKLFTILYGLYAPYGEQAYYFL